MSRAAGVVFGVGNPSRGDDGLGPWLLGRVEDLAAREVLDVDVVPAFQLQVEHALDVQGRRWAVFVDASVDPSVPFSFAPVVARPPAGVSHALAPGEVVDVLGRVLGAEVPPCFVLAVRGHGFGLGEPLSAAGRSDGDAAWAFLSEWLRRQRSR